MAGRPHKQTVDYFSHDTDASEGKTLTIIQNKFGLEGYAFWFKLLERLGKSEGHYFDGRNGVDWQFLIAKIGITEQAATEIIDALAGLDAIDRKLWEKKVIWSEKFVLRLAEVYKKRGLPLPPRPILDNEKSIFDNGKSIIGTSPLPVITQSKVKESKVKESISLSELHSDLVNQLKTLILQNNPKAKIPANLDGWAREFDLMVRVDKRDPEEIAKVIEFSQHDDFWHTNILSAGKLREKYDQLYLKMKEDHKPQGKEKNFIPQHYEKVN